MLNRSCAVLFPSLALCAGLIFGGCASGSCGPGGPGGDGGGGGRSFASPTLMLAPEHATGGVGVVRRTDLLVEYYGSARHAAAQHTLAGMFAEAETAGHEAEAAAIAAYGEAMQAIAHRQLLGAEPLYTVLVELEDELRLLMDRHTLGTIVEAGPGVEGTDITDELIAMLR